MTQFQTEIRGDYVYVVRKPDGSATGPCFSLSEERKAIRYADTLNKANNYPPINPNAGTVQPYPSGRYSNTQHNPK